MKPLEDKIRELELMLNDILLIAEFYKDGHIFDKNHKVTHDLLFFRAHKLLGNNWGDIVAGLELSSEKRDELIKNWVEKTPLLKLEDWYRKKQIGCLFDEYAASEDELEDKLKTLQPILKEMFD